MSDQPDDGTQTARRGGKGRPFAKGDDARRNLKGRKKPRQALAAVIRRCVDPHELVETMLEIIDNPKTAARDRIAAFVALADRGWAKPERKSALSVTLQALPPDWQTLPPGARAAYLDQLRASRALPAGDADWSDDDDEE